MVYKSGYAVADAARQNQLDRRRNGVFGYDSSQHTATTGPLAVTSGSSTSAIELDYNGGTVNNRNERVQVTPGTVGLPPGDSEHPRKDLLYVADDSTVQVLPGEPADNQIVDMNGTLYAPLGPQMPRPEPNDASGISGTIIASVTVPAGASESEDVPQSIIHDRRRRARKRPYEGWLSPELQSDFNEYPPGGFKQWPFAVWDGWTFELHSAAFIQPKNGTVDLSEFALTLQLLDLGTESAPENSVIWTTGADIVGHPQDDEPLTTIDVQEDEVAHAYEFRLINDEEDITFDGPQRIAVQARYTIEPTRWR